MAVAHLAESTAPNSRLFSSAPDARSSTLSLHSDVVVNVMIALLIVVPSWFTVTQRWPTASPPRRRPEEDAGAVGELTMIAPEARVRVCVDLPFFWFCGFGIHGWTTHHCGRFFSRLDGISCQHAMYGYR